MDALGCGTFSSELIVKFAFDILQIHSGCIQVDNGRISLNGTPLATGLIVAQPNSKFLSRKIISSGLVSVLADSLLINCILVV
jgi:hypothetical protein